MQAGLVKRMTTKDIHLAVKRADGTEYLMRRFAIMTIEELEDAIRHVTPGQSEELIKKLRKKQRKFTIVENDVIESNEPEKLSAEDNFEAYEGTETDMEHEEKDVKEAADLSLTLEQVRQDEEELSAKLCVLEGEHKVLIAQRREYLLQLGNVRHALKKLRDEVTAKEVEVDQLYSAYEACAAAMEQLNVEKQFQQELLQETRERRAALEKVTIFVYADGNLSIENAEIPQIEDETLREAVNRLLILPEAEPFTVKTVKNMARLHLIVDAFGEKAEIVFDSLELQTFWETVVAV